MLDFILFLQPSGTQESLDQQGSRDKKAATQISFWNVWKSAQGTGNHMSWGSLLGPAGWNSDHHGQRGQKHQESQGFRQNLDEQEQ